MIGYFPVKPGLNWLIQILSCGSYMVNGPAAGKIISIDGYADPELHVRWAELKQLIFMLFG
jgi:hypothetical protein